MNPRLSVASAIFALALSSCVVPLPIVGGGIAGAGVDPLWVRKGAENYRGYTSPAVKVTQLPERKATAPNDRSDLLRRFATRTIVHDDSPTDFAGLTITRNGQAITIARGNRVLVTEGIPSAFHYPLQVASVRVDGVPCLLLATHSRNTTRMLWLGLYRADGTRLYLATVRRGSVWDVVPARDGFTLLGQSDSKRITVKIQ